MKKFIVDRIEGDKAVLECENGDMVNLELKALPKNIKEGDVINFQENSYFLNSDVGGTVDVITAFTGAYELEHGSPLLLTYFTTIL